MPKKSAKKSTAKNSSLDFETALKELEKLVDRMEKGDSTLEQSLEDFERGVELTRTCQNALQTAEQKVQKLVEKQGKLSPEPFDVEPFDED